MTIGEALALPTTIDTETAARLFGVAAETLRSQIRAGGCPVEPIIVGRILKWPTAAILERLGIDHRPTNVEIRVVGSPVEGSSVAELIEQADRAAGNMLAGIVANGGPL